MVRAVSVWEYLRGVLGRVASRPAPDELRARIAAHDAVTLAESTETAVREIRDRGERP